MLTHVEKYSFPRLSLSSVFAVTVTRAQLQDVVSAGNRDYHYTLGCLDEDGQRYIVIYTDLLEAVCELAVLLGCICQARARVHWCTRKPRSLR